MKKLITIVCIIFSTLYKSYTQNLVPNGSFEENLIYNCNSDTLYNYPASSILGLIVKDWFNPTRSSPDYFATSDLFEECSAVIGSIGETSSLGSPLPYHLNHHLGCVLMYPNNEPGNEYREYFEAILTEELIAGNQYQVSLFTSIVAQCDYRVNSLGVYFSNELISDSNETASLNLIPQIQIDTMFGQVGVWTHIIDTITALGGEKFMTIGNFNTDPNTQFEQLENGGDNINFVYYVFDSISVKLISPNYIRDNYLNKLTIFFNPADETLNLIGLYDKSIINYTIYDLTGRIVILNQNLSSQINLLGLLSGIYFLELNDKKNKRTIKFIKT